MTTVIIVVQLLHDLMSEGALPFSGISNNKDIRYKAKTRLSKSEVKARFNKVKDRLSKKLAYHLLKIHALVDTTMSTVYSSPNFHCLASKTLQSGLLSSAKTL